MGRTRAWLIGLLAASQLLASRSMSAQLGAAVSNWAAAPSGPQTQSGRAIQSDVTPGIAFVGVTPCRIVDTRGANGTFGGPALAAGSPRTFLLPAGPCAGIPGNAGAYSLNITAVSPAAQGFVRAYPFGGVAPLVSTVNFNAGVTTANAAVVPAGTLGAITVGASTSSHLLIDINGYYTKFYNAGVQMVAVASVAGGAAVLGQNNSNTDGSHGVGGFAGGTGTVHGVQGQIGNTADLGSSGVHGIGGTADATFGVRGETNSGSIGAAGVKGVGGYGDPLPAGGTCQGGDDCQNAGVRGVNATVLGVPAYGVLGVSRNRGVGGVALTDIGNVILATGFVGYKDSGGNGYGVFSKGDFGGTGAKYFVEPDRTNAARVIRYVALEGPEAGTYFRGTARTNGGEAVIEVPDNFRDVTEEEGLTIQLTPVGELATMAVIAQDLNRIRVRSSKDVTFHYMVNGVRSGYGSFRPETESDIFMPAGPNAAMPAHLNEAQRRKLIENGTYREDGTVNAETAERAGWTRIWAKRERLERQAAASPAGVGASHADRIFRPDVLPE